MSRSRRQAESVIAAALLFLMPAVGLAVTFPQVDNFQGGTTLNWTNGGAPTISNVPDGGPNGAGDSFLQVTSSGIGTGGSRLITFNITQWAGNYTSTGANVAEVSMDLKYISVGDPTVDVQPIRIALFNSPNLPNHPFGTLYDDTGYSSSDGVPGGAFMLPADGAWHHWTFSLSSSALTAIPNASLQQPPALTTELTNVPEFRILSSASPDISGDRVMAQLGIDNVTAVPSLKTGDFNRDSRFDVADIQAMANALADLSGYQAYWQLTDDQLNTLGDFDSDLKVTNLDLQGLINALANGAGSASVSAVPEPATLLQLALGGATLLGLSRRRN
jgi:hypothetical protein